MMELGKLLLTGATGFVGHHLREELDRRGVPYFAFSKSQFDLTDPAAAMAVFSVHRDATAVIHLAAYQAAAEFPARHTGQQFHLNSLIHLNVLEAWRRFLPHARLLAVASSCAYPNLEGPITEDRIMEGQIHGSVYSYAFTKRLLVTGIRAYNDQYGLDGSVLIPATMFGEHDDFHVETAHVVGALIGKFTRAVREGLPAVEIWGDGTQVRDFMDVKQFVEALLHLLPRATRDIVNVGPGSGTTIRDLALMIRDASGYSGELVFKPTSYVGVREKVIDVTRLNRAFEYRISADHRDAIRRTASWYADHYELLRDRRKFAGANMV